MKKNLLLRVLLFCAVPFGVQAQALDENKPVTSLVVKVNNLYHFSKNPLSNFYSLGGEVGLYFNDKLYIGLAQYGSLLPSDIWKDNPYSPDKIRAYNYSLQAGYKFELAAPFYVYTGFRTGYGSMHMEYRYNSGGDTKETRTREKMGGVFASPDLKLGIKVHKYIDVEAGLNYRYQIGNKEKWGLSTEKINGLGAVVSIVGNIPL